MLAAAINKRVWLLAATCAALLLIGGGRSDATASSALTLDRVVQQSAGNPYEQVIVPTTAPRVTFGSVVRMNRSFVHVTVNCLAPRRIYCIGVLTVSLRGRRLAGDTVSLRSGRRVARLRLRKRIRGDVRRVAVRMKVFGADGTKRTVARSIAVR